MKKFNSTLKAVGVALGLMTCAGAFANEISPNLENGQKLYLQGDVSRGIIACIACHGPGGNSVIAMYPSLAGQPAGYIVSQLKHFQAKDGAKPARLDASGKITTMTATVANMTEQDMADLAAYISSQELTSLATSKYTTNKDMVALGRDIWRAGIPSRNVPACASCHGPAGQGMPEEFPRLSGQQPDYVYSQLIAFADGYRQKGGNENMMGTIANRMSRQEIQAVADYATGLR
ncbi:c-type cytochrome [Basilea psittacipulmonis]|uniref:Cytochrome C n=1 Tax=Basilea psittacipulmonis DSM 24701 TaxID=1072685 RepID=A0A077DG15_9BURK|nr:c-type cytochrome [Basilea psittacipulmonis]AIL32103.1 cytochrome C [Basilea psittacipulmonis DSM 24701]